jgi:hypothetical protein
MKKAIQVTILIFMSFIFIGCETCITKEYRYKNTEIPFEWGQVRAKLRGNWNNRGSLTSPYDLFVSARLNERAEGFVAIMNVELIDLDSNQVVFEHRDKILEKVIHVEGDGFYYAFFSFKKMGLQYNRYKLTVNVEIESDTVKLNDNLEFIFEQDYKEYSRNCFLEFIGGL